MRQSAAAVWAAVHFQGTRLGQCDRRTRLISYARALAEEPRKTLPEMFMRKVVIEYATRFLIEKFYEGLKTGLKAEELQLEIADRHFAANALMSIVASRLSGLRELGRAVPEAPARVGGLSVLELELMALA